MGKAIEAVTPPPQAVMEEQPSPVEDAPKSATLISREQLEQLDAAESAAERVQRLLSTLGVQHYSVNPRTSVWVDFCFGVLNFARDDAHLAPEKVLGLLTLAHEMYVFATRPLLDATADSSVSKATESMLSSSQERIELQEHAASKVEVPASVCPASSAAYPSVEAVYGQFREKIRQASGVMTNNSQEQPAAAPPSPTAASSLAAPFSPMEVARIVTFFTSTFFRHLRAYQYVSRVPRPSVVRECPLPTETPLPSSALADASLQSE